MSPTTTIPRRRLDITSFGHRFGPLSSPPSLSYDVRDIPNPPRKFRLQQKVNNDATAVRQWLLSNELFLTRVQDAQQEVLDLIDMMDNNGTQDSCRITVGVSCGAGRHRSVTFANELARRLKGDLADRPFWEVKVRHRDLERKPQKRSVRKLLLYSPA